jgi:GT2 family glycosyltransferase
MGSSVAAVIVTYNRLEKLKTVLNSLEKLTVSPEYLVIVNNASTDGTDKYLAEYEARRSVEDGMKVSVVNLPENVGGAGGFSAGMKYGYDLGADFLWVSDDDGYPEPDSLANLLNGYKSAVDELGPDVPFACSMVKYTDGSICEMNNPVTTWDWGRLLAKGQNSVLVSSCSFVSVLFPRWALEDFGLPYKEYFIWFDDAEYTRRLTKGCPGIQALDSVVIHDMGQNKGVNFRQINEKNAWKFAYGIRNEASYRLHHEGRLSYLLFCRTVSMQMKEGNVAPELQKQMKKKLREAVKFDPQPDYPQA